MLTFRHFLPSWTGWGTCGSSAVTGCGKPQESPRIRRHTGPSRCATVGGPVVLTEVGMFVPGRNFASSEASCVHVGRRCSRLTLAAWMVSHMLASALSTGWSEFRLRSRKPPPPPPDVTQEQVCSLYVTVDLVGAAEEAARGQADAPHLCYSHPDVVAAHHLVNQGFKPQSRRTRE